MPSPVSTTVIRSPLPSTLASTVTRPSRGVWRIAFITTFVSTSRIRSGSRFTSGRSGDAAPFEPDAVRLGLPGQRVHDLADEDRDVRRLPPQRKRTAFGMGERPDIVYQPRQDARFLQHQSQPLIVTRIYAVEQPLEATLDDAQRRPQLVGDVGHQLPPQRVLRLQPADHRVERARVRPEKRRTALDDAHRVLAVRNAIGRADEIACRNTDSPHQADEGERDADKREKRHAHRDGGRPGSLARAIGQEPHDRRDADAAQREDQKKQAACAAQKARPASTPRARVRWRPRLVCRPPGRWPAATARTPGPLSSVSKRHASANL